MEYSPKYLKDQKVSVVADFEGYSINHFGTSLIGGTGIVSKFQSSSDRGGTTIYTVKVTIQNGDSYDAYLYEDEIRAYKKPGKLTIKQLLK